MRLGVTENIFAAFNFYEAIFWFMLSVGFLLARRRTPSRYQLWLFASAVNIGLFGFTDVVELYTGGFLHTATWLLYWKVVHVAGLFVSVGWYLWLRQGK